MKAILVFAVILGVTFAEPPSGYGLPSFGSSGGYSQGSSGGSFGGQQGGQVYRHVYVHAAPDEPEDQQARVIRIPGQGDKHVNIIFVKTPSQSANAQTEVVLPEQDQQKTIVYVLHRKFDASTDLKIRKPAARAPSKPDVYFIKYKDQAAGSGYTGGAPSSSSSSSSSGAYGAPF